MPIHVFTVQGVSEERGRALSMLVESLGEDLHGLHDAWILPSPRGRGLLLRITGPGCVFVQIRIENQDSESDVCRRIREALAQSQQRTVTAQPGSPAVA